LRETPDAACAAPPQRAVRLGRADFLNPFLGFCAAASQV